jgi:MCM AAA-lid domain
MTTFRPLLCPCVIFHLSSVCTVPDFAAQAFYLSLRAATCGGVSGGLPVTARQLESLVRLAEARARCELREVVTAEDALVRGCVLCVFVAVGVRVCVRVCVCVQRGRA